MGCAFVYQIHRECGHVAAILVCRRSVGPGFWRWLNQAFLRGASKVASRYNFNFAVARQCGDGWEALTPRQLQSAYRAPVARGQIRATLARMWLRIWNELASPRTVERADASGATSAAQYTVACACTNE
jgi:hypothetical protein